MNGVSGGNAIKIKALETEIISLKQKDEITRQQQISSRTSFYESQANLMGKIAAIIFKLELVHCRATPFMFNREILMLDFYDYNIESGLDAALLHAMRILAECEND